MRDLGQASSILDINIEREGTTGSLRLSQRKYICELLKRFGMTDAKPVATPMEANAKPSKEECPKQRGFRCETYRTENSSLDSYICLMQREPEISFSVNTLSRFCRNFGLIH